MRCVYTVLLGGYEDLNEQPTAHTSSIDFICLTDDPHLTSDTWKIEVVTPLLKDDSIRSQRHLKIMGHEALKDYSETLYIDNSVLLTTEPEELFEKFGNRACIALPIHSFRATVEEEFQEIAALYLDDPELIGRQHRRYEESRPMIFTEHPYWTAILIRDHSLAELKPLMEMWWSEVAHFSRRDQLSINACLSLSHVEPLAIHIDNYHSWFHQWPATRSKREDIRHWQGQVPTRASVVKRATSKLIAQVNRFKRQK